MRIESIVKAQILAVVLLVVVTAGSTSAVTQFPNTSALVIGKVKPVTNRALICPRSSLEKGAEDEIGTVTDASGLACLGVSPDLAEASKNDEIYPGYVIETDTGARMSFKTLDVKQCDVLENSRLQIRPPLPVGGEEKDRLAIKWIDTEPPADSPGGSWCIKREEEKTQAYGIGCKSLDPEVDECIIEIRMETNTFGVVVGADRDVIKIPEGSATAVVAGVPFMIKAKEQLVIPTEGVPTTGPIDQSIEDIRRINLLKIEAAAPNTLPTAFAVNSTVAAGGEVAITLQGSADDDLPCELTFTPTSTPTSGTLSSITDQSCTEGSPNSATATLTYTHNGSDTTSDSFTYQVCDNATPQGCATATVNITIIPTEEPPTPTPTEEPPTEEPPTEELQWEVGRVGNQRVQTGLVSFSAFVMEEFLTNRTLLQTETLSST